MPSFDSNDQMIHSNKLTHDELIGLGHRLREEAYAQQREREKVVAASGIPFVVGDQVAWSQGSTNKYDAPLVGVGKVVGTDDFIKYGWVQVEFNAPYGLLSQGLTRPTVRNFTPDGMTLVVVEPLVEPSQEQGKVEIVNLTPHELNLVGEGGETTTVAPTGTVARCATQTESLPSVAGLAVVRRTFGQVEALPEPRKGTIYVVSSIVLSALKDSRPDVYCPGEAVRDESGKQIAAKGLSK